MQKFPVVNFMHDAFLIELAMSDNLATRVREVEEIIVKALCSVMPNMKPRMRSVLMDRWYPDAKPTFTEDGEFAIFTKAARHINEVAHAR